MSNCLNCGREIFVGNVASLGIFIGFCDCAGVPEVDVYVIDDTLPCCVTMDKIVIFCSDCGHEGSDPCSCSLPVYCVVCDKCTCDGKCDDGRVEIEDEDFIYVYEEAEVLAAVGCQSCGQAACQGPNERGYCLEYYDNENEAALRKFQGLEEDGPEPRHEEEAWSFSNDVLMVMAIIGSFFSLLYAIGTGKNNDPKLVIAWYAFCAYLIVSYSAVIIWFLC